MHGSIRNLRPEQSALPILVVLHQEMSTPGRVGHYLQAHGIPLDIRRPALGCPLPETLERHAGVVVFGGPMSANDETDFIRREIEWLSVPLKEREAVSWHLPRRPDAGAAPGSPGLLPSRRLGGDRLLPAARHGCRSRRVRGLAVACLPVASRGLRSSRGRGAAGAKAIRSRCTGFPLWAMCLRGPVSRRSHARHDVPMDDPRSRPHGAARSAPRTEHYADRPVYDPAIRRWLADFLDQWIVARVAA